jgi:4-hydroxyphenylpyruvate dioxygenase-like putative hemolysin
MTQVSLIDSGRLSALLQEALSWNNDISSMMVSAQNGSILAYTFRHHTPSVKAMRTRSTTVTTAYAIAEQETLVFEAQRTGALTVVSAIADQILLSVTGPEPQGIDPYEKTVHEAVPEETGEIAEELEEEDQEVTRLRAELEAVNQELVGMLKDELAGMKWPEDI